MLVFNIFSTPTNFRPNSADGIAAYSNCLRRPILLMVHPNLLPGPSSRTQVRSLRIASGPSGFGRKSKKKGEEELMEESGQDAPLDSSILFKKMKDDFNAMIEGQKSGKSFDEIFKAQSIKWEKEFKTARAEGKGGGDKQTAEEFTAQMKKFAEEYKKGSDNPTYAKTLYFIRVSTLIYMVPLAMLLIYWLLSGNVESPEFEGIFNSTSTTSVSLDIFLEEFLKTGEVQKIVFFPLKNKAIAYLYPDAVIQNHTFIGNTVVIDVSGDESLSGLNVDSGEFKFKQAIRAAEHRLHIGEGGLLPIQIEMKPTRGVLAAIIPFLLGGILFVGISLRKQFNNNKTTTKKK